MVRTKKKGTRRVSLMFSTHSEVLGDLLLGTLSKRRRRRRRRRGHGKTKDLIGRAIAQRVRFKTLYIS